jgi:N-acetylglucosamine-6-sulfatase
MATTLLPGKTNMSRQPSPMVRLTVAALLIITLLSCDDFEPRLPGRAERYAVDPQRRPNLIVLVVDDLRWDELGVAGHPYLETPNIDGPTS